MLNEVKYPALGLRDWNLCDSSGPLPLEWLRNASALAAQRHE